MPRKRLTAEERIKRLIENRDYIINQRVEGFKKMFTAIYDARIDLLREKGLREAKPARKVAARTLEEMMEKAKDRFIFFRTRFYVHMGFPEHIAKAKAEEEYEKYRMKWLISMKY